MAEREDQQLTRQIQPTQKAARLICSDGVDASRHAIAADSIRLLSGASRLLSSGWNPQRVTTRSRITECIYKRCLFSVILGMFLPIST